MIKLKNQNISFEGEKMSIKKMIREAIRRLKEESNQIPIEDFTHYPRVGQRYKVPNGEYEIVSYGPKGPVNYKPRTTPFTIKFSDGETKVIKQKDIPNWFKYQWLVK